MKKLFIFLIFFIIFENSASANSRFGVLTELRDEKMRGEDGKWVRPHPGPFVWNNIEKEKGNFTWEDTDKYCVKEKKQEVHLANNLLNI